MWVFNLNSVIPFQLSFLCHLGEQVWVALLVWERDLQGAGHGKVGTVTLWARPLF